MGHIVSCSFVNLLHILVCTCALLQEHPRPHIYMHVTAHVDVFLPKTIMPAVLFWLLVTATLAACDCQSLDTALFKRLTVVAFFWMHT